MTGEQLTEESIKADEEAIKTLSSNIRELEKLIGNLLQKDKEINSTNADIERIEQKPPTTRPTSINLQYESEKYGWKGYFDGVRESLRNKEELVTLNKKLVGQKKERTEIEEKIRPLVPQRLYDVKITNGPRSLTVTDESVVVSQY